MKINLCFRIFCGLLAIMLTNSTDGGQLVEYVRQKFTNTVTQWLHSSEDRQWPVFFNVKFDNLNSSKTEQSLTKKD